METFSYADLTVAKRRQLARNLYHLIDCKHPSLLVYLTLINDRSRCSYSLVSEAATLRPLSDELCVQTSLRIFSTTHSITAFLIDLLGAVKFVFDRHMHKEAIKLLCHSISRERVSSGGWTRKTSTSSVLWPEATKTCYSSRSMAFGHL